MVLEMILEMVSKDLTEDGCILYPEQCYFLCKISFLSLLSSIYAIYKGYYELALIPFGVFLTSLIYWYKPQNCWRRTLDVTYVKFALIYNLIRAWNSEFYILYYMTFVIGSCFYPLGIYLYNNNFFWESTYAHSMLHIFANISNIILYSGSVIPFTQYFDYFNPISSIKECIDIPMNNPISLPTTICI